MPLAETTRHNRFRRKSPVTAHREYPVFARLCGSIWAILAFDSLHQWLLLVMSLAFSSHTSVDDANVGHANFDNTGANVLAG
jgi:hypothetical protein